MVPITLYDLTREQIEESAQNVKIAMLNAMVKNGDITEEVYQDYQKNCAILFRKPTFFGSLWKKLLKTKVEGFYYIVVRQLNMTEDTFKSEGKEDGKK